MDWGQAEELAFASLLLMGVPVRLTGQDTERGTSTATSSCMTPRTAGLRAHPAPGRSATASSRSAIALSEEACLGFEYGYSVAAPEALVAWEAQFPATSSTARRSGGRPVHRLGPFEVRPDVTADPSAPARLRGQWPRALERTARAVPSARCAGEHPDRELHDRRASTSTAAPPGARPERAPAGRDDAEVCSAEGARVEARRSGRWSVQAALGGIRPRRRRRAPARGLLREALLRPRRPRAARRRRTSRGRRRLEQLYPFPVAPTASSCARSRGSRRSSGRRRTARHGRLRAIRHRLEESLPEGARLATWPPWRASPSEGYPTAHLKEQDRIVREALTL